MFYIQYNVCRNSQWPCCFVVFEFQSGTSVGFGLDSGVSLWLITYDDHESPCMGLNNTTRQKKIVLEVLLARGLSAVHIMCLYYSGPDSNLSIKINCREVAQMTVNYVWGLKINVVFYCWWSLRRTTGNAVWDQTTLMSIDIEINSGRIK